MEVWLLHPLAMLTERRRRVVGRGTTLRRTAPGVRTWPFIALSCPRTTVRPVTVTAHAGYLALALLVGGESLGLVLPGETALLTAGVLARSGRLEIGLVIPIAAAAAIAGDGIGYLLGRRGVRTLLVVRGPLREQRTRLAREGERFFDRYGAPAVFLGRWVAFARVTVPWLAGAGRMPPPRFAAYNALGGISWSATVALAGYTLGAAAAAIFTAVTIVALTVLVALRAQNGAPATARSAGRRVRKGLTRVGAGPADAGRRARVPGLRTPAARPGPPAPPAAAPSRAPKWGVRAAAARSPHAAI
jgi:membrane protein DedA with SNARE-associated domain